MQKRKKGFVSIHRCLLQDSIWLSEKFTRAQAWVDLILLANYKDGFIRKSGVRIELKRGELGWSKLDLSKRWQWSRGKVDRFLNELESVQWIEQRTGQHTTIIKILEYNAYQDVNGKIKEETVQHSEHEIEQQTDTKQDNHLNNNNNKNNNIYISEDEFLEFWEACPKKVGLANARSRYEEARQKQSHDFLMEKITAYAKSVYGRDDKFILQPANWLRDERYHDQEVAKDEPQEVDSSGWSEWKKRLAGHIGAHSVDAWFKHAQFDGSVIRVPTKFLADRINQEHIIEVQKALGERVTVICSKGS